MLNISEENSLLYNASIEGPEFDEDRATLLRDWLDSIPNIADSLDIGCYSGGFSDLLSNEVAKSGLDFERHPCLDERITFHACNIAHSWKLPESSFDVVLAGEVIEHMLDTGKFLRQCYHVLRSGGHLLLTTPNLASFANLRFWLQAEQFMWVDSGANQFGHVRYLAPKCLERALYQTGFINVKMKSVSGLEKLNFFPPLRRFVQRAFPLRGNRLCVMACKP